jgi:hypothetical protein
MRKHQQLWEGSLLRFANLRGLIQITEKLQDACPSRLFFDFHICSHRPFGSLQWRSAQECRKNGVATRVFEPRDIWTAPNALHTPVNHLHSIENSADTVPHFSLTLKMKRVKRYSFFDSF